MEVSRRLIQLHGDALAKGFLMATAQELRAALSAHLDSRAQAAGFSSMLEAVSYADEPAAPRLMHKGAALRRWRSLVMDRALDLLADVEAGRKDFSWPQFKSRMPRVGEWRDRSGGG